MKNQIKQILFSISLLVLPIYAMTQSTYNMINNSTNLYGFEVRIANNANQCGFFQGLQTRTVTDILPPSGCSGNPYPIAISAT